MKNSENNSKNMYNNNTSADIYSDSFNTDERYVDIYSSRKTKKFGLKKWLLILFFGILGIIGSAMIYAYKMMHLFNYNDLGEETLQENSEILVDDFGNDLINDSMVLNVMLIGSDSMSVGDHGRSDSLLILSLDLKNQKIKITSLMRDIWINIPGYGKDRLNAAYAYGGPKLTIETIEKTFGLKIDRYAVVDFDGFSKIVDTLGGIDLELSAAECVYINTYSGDPHKLKGSGVKHLTGLQALHYSRDRNSKGSDYDRTSRQRNVIRAVINKLKSANISQINSFITTTAPMITTNFKTSEISRLATSAPAYLNYPLSEFRLPTNDNVKDATFNQKMVLVISDLAKARSDLFEFIYENKELATKQSSKIKNQNSSSAEKTKPEPASSAKSNKQNSNSVEKNKSQKSLDRSYQSTKSQKPSQSPKTENHTPEKNTEKSTPPVNSEKSTEKSNTTQSSKSTTIQTKPAVKK